MEIRRLALPMVLLAGLAAGSKSGTPPPAPAATTPAPAATSAPVTAPAPTGTPAPAPAAGPASVALPPPAVPMSALPKVDGAAILQRIKTMSSDKFQGRAPG